MRPCVNHNLSVLIIIETAAVDGFDITLKSYRLALMKPLTISFGIFASSCTFCLGGWIQEPVAYELDKTEFRGLVVYDEELLEAEDRVPGIFMVPNWMGPDTAASLEKAKEIAGDDFIVFIADLYGVNVRPGNASEAAEAAGFVRADRLLMRARTAKAFGAFQSLANQHPIDPSRMLGVGFCFGGGALLEYARSGSDQLEGIVSFHGDLASPTLERDAHEVRTPLLVLHGAEDPYVPQSDVEAFISAMRESQVDDWTLVQFSGAVHSFTDPTADSDGARYDKRTAGRAFEMMEEFAEDVLPYDD